MALFRWSNRQELPLKSQRAEKPASRMQGHVAGRATVKKLLFGVVRVSNRLLKETALFWIKDYLKTHALRYERNLSRERH